MTVLFQPQARPQDPQRSHNAFRTRRDDPEPRLHELLDDPILQALMTRDGVNRPALLALVGETRRRLGLVAMSPASLFEASLFAECRAAA